MIMMCVVVLMLMTILATGSCMKCEEVNVIEGENATLRYTTSGLTHFYEIDCKTEDKIGPIGQYCGPDENCTTSRMAPNVSVAPDGVILNNVTSNKCYRAEPISGEKQCYNVTAKKPLHSTISPEISNSKFSTATPFYSSTSDTPGASKHIGAIAGGVAGGVVVVVVGVVGCYKWNKRRNGQVNSVV